MIPFDEAADIIDRVAAERRLPPERLALARTHGRVLMRDIDAPIAQPPFDNSAMDGHALRHADLDGETTLQLKGEQFAGRALGLRVDPGTCIRITTGAPLPEGADTVVIREVVRVEGDRIVVPAGIKQGANIRRAGEDLRAGDRVLQAGQVLTPARVASVASVGIDAMEVSTRPTVAVFTTGDELVPPGLPLAPGEIHDSNRPLLQSLLLAEGLEPVAWPVLPDEPAAIAAALADAAFSFDLVITCGGVSAGERDFLPSLLQREGTVHFWKVALRPGMPLIFGRWGQAHFLGLPGNPVSVLATFLTLGRQLLDGIEGATSSRPLLRARLSQPIRKTHPRREFLRGHLHCGDDGTLVVAPNPADGSHRLAAAAASNALIVLAEGEGTWDPGAVLDVLPYADWR